MSLDDASDPQVVGLAKLCRYAVNSNLQTQLGTDAVRYTVGAPFPLSLIKTNNTPALCIYRFEDRDLDKGYQMFEAITTWNFDYYAPATSITKLDKRWPILQLVWWNMVSAIRSGRDSRIADGVDLNLGRYILGSARANYTFVAGAEQTYPAFRGQLQLQHCFEPPFEWDGEGLDDFDTLWTDWDLKPETNSDLEAQNETKPNG